MNEIEKAERMQAWKAFLIPASLFVACLFNAAGIYILYNGNSVGVFFIGLGFAIIVSGMFAFVTFHNRHREAGNWKRLAEEPADEFDASPHEELSFDPDATPVEPLATVQPKVGTRN